MTWAPSARRRPAFIRYALAVGLVVFAAYVAHSTSCDDRLPGIVLLPAMAVQLLSGVFSFGWAVVALVRADQGKAFTELRVGVLMVLAIAVAVAVFDWVPSQSCE